MIIVYIAFHHDESMLDDLPGSLFLSVLDDKLPLTT